MISPKIYFVGILLTVSHAAAEGPIHFNKVIRPILSENCFHCHGPDPGSRKAGLRLDTKEGFFASTDKRGPTVIAGNADGSPLYQRLTTTDPDDHMPPAESHKELKPEEISLVKAWINQGANWLPHWSLIKPERPPVPTVAHAGLVRNPIDAFVLQKLEANGLEPAPQADRHALARRLSLDLTGLPPDPAEVEAFVADQAPDAYEKLVATWMARPQWGEHRGRYWLDAARYADTHGLHFDNYREIWPYRDWVINAFNKNQPFDQFTIEQVAGDLLPKPTPDQLVATGFHRCNITTNEGGTIAEENLALYARERVETTGWVWLGLTTNCAVCHDHKFDPISSKDFYALSAFFRNTTQAAFDGNVRDTQPSIRVPLMADRSRLEALPAEIAAGQKEIETVKQQAQPRFEKWIATLPPGGLSKEIPSRDLVVHAPLNEGKGEEVSDVCNQPTKTYKATAPVTWQPGGKLGASPVFAKGMNFDFGAAGDFEKSQAFSYGAWILVPKGFGAYGAVMARMDVPGAGYRGWDLFINNGTELAAHFVNHWPDNAMKVRTKQSGLRQGEWEHVFVTYDGSGKPEGLKIFLNGKQTMQEVETNTLKDSIRTNASFRVGQRTGGEAFEGGSVQDVRIYSRLLDPEEVAVLANNSTLESLLAIPADKRTPEQTASLFNYYVTTKEDAWNAAQQKVRALEGERDAINSRSPVAHVQQEKMDAKPMAAVLFRGSYDQPRDQVEATTPAALHSFPADAPHNRLGLAQWIMSPENPLTARVTVNRFWQEIFGTGLVKTSEDFGIMGDAPSHPELLDWLAVEFKESGYDVKKLFTLMVTSATYRQAAVATPEKVEKDPANRLLSRGPRFRMDAEVIRDAALQASGLLVKKIGGASVRPYQPDGIWEAVAMPESDTKNYRRDAGEALYRRSMYTFWKRAAPPASMEIFNATAREVSCLRRERANTPLQALVTMNDVQFVEASRYLAEQALKVGAGTNDSTKSLQTMAQRILSRPFRKEELDIVNATLAEQLAYYKANVEEAAKLITFGESKPDPALDSATLAAWTMVANQVMNLDEALNK